MPFQYLECEKKATDVLVTDSYDAIAVGGELSLLRHLIQVLRIRLARLDGSIFCNEVSIV